MTDEPFVRAVRAGWPETCHAEVFALGQREVIVEGEASIEATAAKAEAKLAEQGLRLAREGWQDIGPCCKEAEIE